MNPAAVARRAALLVGATAVLVLSGGLAWAAVNDYSSRDIVPPGVSVAGTDLSGMTAADARVAIERSVSESVKRPVTVVASDKTFVFDPSGAVTVDTQAMLDEAMAPRRTAPFVARLRADLADGVLAAEVTPRYAVDPTATAAFLAKVRKDIDTKALECRGHRRDGQARRHAFEDRAKARRGRSAEGDRECLLGGQGLLGR